MVLRCAREAPLQWDISVAFVMVHHLVRRGCDRFGQHQA